MAVNFDRLGENVRQNMCQYAVTFGVTAASVGFFFFLKKFGIIYNLFHKVDENSKRHGGELVAEVLKKFGFILKQTYIEVPLYIVIMEEPHSKSKRAACGSRATAHNVKQIFALAGGHISPILVACEKMGVRVVDTRHEVTAVFAADAVARMSGTVGVAAVTAGPGVTNTVTAVKNAQMAESPLLLIGGAAATLLKGRGALQDIDQLSLFKPLCKFCATVTSVRDIVPTLRQALQIAQSGTPGPVFVEFPIDTLYPYQLVKKEIGMKDKGGAATLSQRVVDWYLNNHLTNLFAGAWETRDTTPLPVNIPQGSQSQIQKCIELISKAKKPVIILGSQATLPPTPVEDLKKALELSYKFFSNSTLFTAGGIFITLGIPCFLGGMSRGLLGRHSDIQVRQQRREALREADLIILAGSVCDFRLSYGRVFPRRTKIIAINRNKEQLLKNSDMFWKPTVPVQADVASFLVDVINGLKGYKCDPDWVKLLRKRDLEKETENKSKCSEATDIHLNPVKVLHVLEEVLSNDAILVADGGDFVATASYILRPRGPLRWLDPGAFGTLGVGGGFALGAKLCRPESDVWIIYGDGSLGYSIVEFDTYTRHKTPVIALVGNDASWMQIAREQVPMFGTDVACKLEYCKYEMSAEGLGGKGLRLDRTNEAELFEVLHKAVELSHQGSSVLINVLIGKTNFREGSISV